VKVEKHVVKTKQDYQRYELTENGISPRGVPGYGRGLVCVDSDEHDTHGHITEDLGVRIKMVAKRLKKGHSLSKETIEPELVGPDTYKTLVLCWGSTYHAVAEAVRNVGRDDVALLHFKQVHPLPEKTAAYLERAERTVIVEGNATGQLGRQIKLHTGIDVDKRILKYNGLSFSVEEVEQALGSLIN